MFGWVTNFTTGRPFASPRPRAFSRKSNASAVTKSCAAGSTPFSRNVRCADACAAGAESTEVTRPAPPSAAATEKPPA